MLMTIHECKLFYIYILSRVFLSLKIYLYFLILQEKIVYKIFLEYVANAHGSWLLIKGAPPGVTPKGNPHSYDSLVLYLSCF